MAFKLPYEVGPGISATDDTCFASSKALGNLVTFYSLIPSTHHPSIGLRLSSQITILQHILITNYLSLHILKSSAPKEIVFKE